MIRSPRNAVYAGLPSLDVRFDTGVDAATASTRFDRNLWLGGGAETGHVENLQLESTGRDDVISAQLAERSDCRSM